MILRAAASGYVVCAARGWQQDRQGWSKKIRRKGAPPSKARWAAAGSYQGPDWHALQTLKKHAQL